MGIRSAISRGLAVFDAFGEEILWHWGGSYWNAEHRRDFILDQDGRQIMTESGKPLRGVRMTEVDYEGRQSWKVSVKVFVISMGFAILLFASAVTYPGEFFENPAWMVTGLFHLYLARLSCDGLVHGLRAKTFVPTAAVDQAMADDWDEGDYGHMPVTNFETGNDTHAPNDGAAEDVSYDEEQPLDSDDDQFPDDDIEGLAPDRDEYVPDEDMDTYSDSEDSYPDESRGQEPIETDLYEDIIDPDEDDGRESVA